MAVTPNYGWPVPVATDYVKDGWEAISDLGNAIDTTVAGLGSGLTLVKSQTIGTAVSSVVVTGAFSASYENYLITITGGAASTNAWGTMILGSTTTGYYHAQFGTSWNSTFTGSGGANAASWGQMGTITTDGLNAIITMSSPFLSKKTFYSVTSNDMGTGYGLQGFGFLNNTTSYTGFTWSAGSGTITGGTIRVYGYQI